MTAIDRTIYPRFRLSLTQTELRDYFSPSEAELVLAQRKTREPTALLTLLALLKTSQRLSRVPSLGEIPAEIVAHLRWYLGLDDSIQIQASVRSFTRYSTIVRDIMQIDGDGVHARAVASAAMTQAAQTMDMPPDIINAAIETLIKDRCELPAFSTLDRLAGTIRTQINDAWCATIMQRLPDTTRASLLALLQTQQTNLIVLPPPTSAGNASGGEKSPFAQLKLIPQSATLGHLEIWFEHLTWLRDQGETATYLAEMPASKVRHLAAEARALDAAELRHYTEARRITLILCLLHDAQVRTQDALVTMFTKRMASIHAQGKRSLDEFRKKKRESQEQWIEALADIARAAEQHPEPDNAALGQETRAVVSRFGAPDTFSEALEVLVKYHGDNYYPLLWKPFKSHWKTLLKMVATLDIRSTSQDQSVINAIAYLLEH